MLIGIKEIMGLLGVGRPTAERYARLYLGKNHHKGMKFLVPREGFIEWINNGMS